MLKPSSRRAKLALFPTKPIIVPTAGQTEDDYAIYASYRPQGEKFVGTLKVVRLTDAKLLYPFDGVGDIGPFPTKEMAREAAALRGNDIVHADLTSPEL